MDERVKYQIADRKFKRRAEMLSRLDDATQQKREIGIVAAALETATNDRNWNLVERLGLLLMKYRESQLKAKKDNETLVDVDHFRCVILTPLLDAITYRIKEALPSDYENVIDLIENRGIYLTPPPTRDCGLSNESNGTGSICTACWTKR